MTVVRRADKSALATMTINLQQATVVSEQLRKENATLAAELEKNNIEINKLRCLANEHRVSKYKKGSAREHSSASMASTDSSDADSSASLSQSTRQTNDTPPMSPSSPTPNNPNFIDNDTWHWEAAQASDPR
jgi:hypothetical protein